MQMTQQDYAERLNRIESGEADDEDRRLVKHYRREGFAEPDRDSADGSWLLSEDDSEIDDQYSRMEYRDLQQTCRDRALSGSGTAAALRSRLREWDSAQDNGD